MQGPEQTLCGFGVLVRPGAGVVSVGFGLFGLKLGGRFAQFDSAIPPVIMEAVLEGTSIACGAQCCMSCSKSV